MPKREQPPTRAVYGRLPIELVSSAHPDLDPLTLAVVASILTSAAFARGNQLHADAFAGGAEKIEAEKEAAEQFREDWEETNNRRRSGQAAHAPQRYHTFTSKTPFKPKKFGMALKRAGELGYEQRKKELRKRPAPEIVRIEITKSALLRRAGLSADAKNLGRLDSILMTLTKPLVMGDRKRSPLLNSVRKLSSGRLRMNVAGEWLNNQFRKIPLPLPTRSRVATSLYLFLHFIRIGPTVTEHISERSLYAKLLIASPDVWVCRQSLKRALDVVNQHVAKLDAVKLRKHGIKLPAAFDVLTIDRSHIRFTAIAQPGRNEFSGRLNQIRNGKRNRPSRDRVRLDVETDDIDWAALALPGETANGARHRHLRAKQIAVDNLDRDEIVEYRQRQRTEVGQL